MPTLGATLAASIGLTIGTSGEAADCPIIADLEPAAASTRAAGEYLKREAILLAHCMVRRNIS